MIRLRAYSGMLSSENGDFKFLKTAKNIKFTCITIVPGSSLSLTSIAKSCIIYFPKYRNFDTGNFSLTLSIFTGESK